MTASQGVVYTSSETGSTFGIRVLVSPIPSLRTIEHVRFSNSEILAYGCRYPRPDDRNQDGDKKYLSLLNTVLFSSNETLLYDKRVD